MMLHLWDTLLLSHLLLVHSSLLASRDSLGCSPLLEDLWLEHKIYTLLVKMKTSNRFSIMHQMACISGSYENTFTQAVVMAVTIL